MNNYFICIDNFILEPLENKIHFEWIDEFIGREIKPNFYEEFDKFEETFLCGEELADKGCYFTIETKIQDNVITDIEYGKFRDHDTGHGRPITYDVKITKKEIKIIRNFYDSNTVGSTQEQYENLIKSLETKGLKSNDFKYIKATTKGITLKENENTQILVNKNSIIDSLAISHSYIDALFNRRLLESNPDLFDQKIIDPLLAILSCVDYSSYRNKDKLLRQAKNRKEAETAEKGYKKLLKYVIENNVEKVKEYVSYAAITDKDVGYNKTPLNIAVRNNNTEIVQMLVDNDVCLLHNSSWKNRCTAIQVAIENKYYECQRILSVVLGNYNKEVAPFYIKDIYKALYSCRDFKTIKIVFPSTIGKCESVMEVSKFEKAFGIDELYFFAELKNASILWDLRNIAYAYQVDKDLVFKLVSQGCTEDVVDFFIEKDEYNLFESSIKQQNNFYSTKNHEKAYSLILNRDEKWFETAKNHTETVSFVDFWKNSLVKIYKNDKETFYKIVKKLKLPIDSLKCIAEEISDYIKNNQIDQLKNYIDEYKININSFIFSVAEPYIDKLPEDQKMGIILYCVDHHGTSYYSKYYSYQFDTIKDIGKTSDYLTNFIMENLPESISATIINQLFEFKPKSVAELVARFKEFIGASVFFEKKQIGSTIIDAAFNILENNHFEHGYSVSEAKWEMMRYLFIIEREKIIGLSSPRKKENQERIVRTVDYLTHYYVSKVNLDEINFEQKYYLSSKEETLKLLFEFDNDIKNMNLDSDK